MNYEFASAENIGDRKEQQDRVAIATHPTEEDVLLAVLADGMGGHKGGAIASQSVVDAAMGVFASFKPGTGVPRDWLHGMVMAAHERVARAGRGHNRDPRSTCAIALVSRERIDWVHCGDSRLYQFRAGEFAGRTEDHSMVEILVKQGEISEDDALVHPDRSKLFTSLGGPEAPQMAFGSIEQVEPGDAVLLASDGLWAYFRNRELAALVGYRGPTEACDRLVALARRRAAGNGDNLSVIMVRRTGSVAKRRLLGALFNAAGTKPVAPSSLEDCRRFLLAYLRGAGGAGVPDLVRRVEGCATPEAMREVIGASGTIFAAMTSRAKADAFASRALDLLD
ncbi:MAG: serine/threonine-protein phosphatase [Burkholderiales bacterium]|nr:serine/threonine-protein phosphatase [Burkholderiales bacterium]